MIAYRLFRAGKHKAKVRPGREWLPVRTGVLDEAGREIDVPIGSVFKYLNGYFWEALDLYNDFVLFEQLPYSGGPYEQPYEVYRVLKILIAETNRWESAEREEKHGRGKKGNLRTRN